MAGNVMYIHISWGKNYSDQLLKFAIILECAVF